MKQAELLVMADYALPRETVPQTTAEVRLLSWEAIGRDEDFQGGFRQFPETVEPQMDYMGTTSEGDRLLHWCGIRIRISRHVITFHLPVLFKTWLDFDACRIGLNRFLCTFLRPFQCERLLFLPSCWEQPEQCIHNELQRKRLAQMQYKITHAETSFKRCRQHLEHCLGGAAPPLREATRLLGNRLFHRGCRPALLCGGTNGYRQPGRPRRTTGGTVPFHLPSRFPGKCLRLPPLPAEKGYGTTRLPPAARL